MSTHAIKGTKVLNDTSIVAARQASDLQVSLSRKLMGLLDATMLETWLPMGFRVLVVQEFPSMRRLVEQGRSGNEPLLAYVEQLMEESEPYKTFSKRSMALRSLRELYADLVSARVAA